MLETHYHPCVGYCPPDSPTEATFTAPALADLADQITIELAARATDARWGTERDTWWAAAALAHRHGQQGDADVVG